MKLHDQLNAYLDNELEPEARVEVEEALAQSSELREELQALQMLKADFSPLGNTPEPTGKAELVSKIRDATKRPTSRGSWARLPQWGWGMGAILVLFAVAVTQEFRPGGGSDRAMGETASMQAARTSAENAEAMPSPPASAAVPSPEEMDRATVDAASKASVGSSAPNVALPPAVTQRGKLTGRDIIRVGSLQVEVENVRIAMNNATNLVNGFGGYVVTSNSSAVEGQVPTGMLEVRIPVGKFDEALRQLSEMGRVVTESISGQDVTAEIAAGEGRVRALADAEQTYLRMLQQARSTSAQIEIRRRLDEVRAERAALRAETERMKDLAAMSSLSLSFTEKSRVVANEQNEGWWKDSWQGASNALETLGRVVGRVGIYALFLSPVWLTVLGVAVWNRRKRS